MEQTTAEREEKEAENSGKKELLELLRSEKESICVQRRHELNTGSALRDADCKLINFH